MTDLKTLCLATMATEWRPLAAQATRERQPPAEYLAQLVHLEVTGRRERRIQRRLQEARFPMLKTLDAFQVRRRQHGVNVGLLQRQDGAVVEQPAVEPGDRLEADPAAGGHYPKELAGELVEALRSRPRMPQHGWRTGGGLPERRARGG